MRIQFTFFISLLFCFQASLFGQFTDDFTDGNFSANPVWVGETTKFQIDAQNRLQLNDGAATSPAYLSTSSAAIYNTSWEFYVRLEFAPSASNYAKVVLVSNGQDITGSFDGYYVKIGGETGTVDDVSLFRQDGSSSTKIIDGVDGTAAARMPLLNATLFALAP